MKNCWRFVRPLAWCYEKISKKITKNEQQEKKQKIKLLTFTTSKNMYIRLWPHIQISPWIITVLMYLFFVRMPPKPDYQSIYVNTSNHRANVSASRPYAYRNRCFALSRMALSPTYGRPTKASILSVLGIRPKRVYENKRTAQNFAQKQIFPQNPR